MFDRYTAPARRIIFFARHEASQTGSKAVATEHLLLGLMRENMNLLEGFPAAKDLLAVRVDLFGADAGERTSTEVEMPLSESAKRVLQHASDESEALGHKLVGASHLLLGILDEAESPASRLLEQHGIARGGVLRGIDASLLEDKAAPDLGFPPASF